MTDLRTYESMLVLKPNLSKEETEQLLEKFQGVIRDGGGETVKVDRMGKRRIAYEMKKQQEGYYALIHFKAPGNLIAEMERQFRLSEPVLHFQIFKQQKPSHRAIKLSKPKAKAAKTEESSDSAEPAAAAAS